MRLLAETHYQSALHDAEHLLAGRLALWIAGRTEGPHGEPLGAALVAFEGDIDPALGADIVSGRRRLPDQLLPQLLARTARDTAALGARYVRVVRIAVAPHARRRGIGSALLAAIATGAYASKEHALTPPSAAGAAFADEPGAAAFWHANEFATFHVGTRVNPRSGTASRAVLRVDDGARTDATQRGGGGVDHGDGPEAVARAAISALRVRDAPK